MRLSRRHLFGLAAGTALAPLFGRRGEARAAKPTPIEIRATPIASFLPSDPQRRRFGALLFRSGLQLSGRHDDFGGWSGLWRSADGRELVALSDQASWLTARPVYAGGRLSGLEAASIGPVLGADGGPLWRGRAYDTEALTISGGTAYVAIERVHQVMRFDWGKHGMLARGHAVPVPREARRLPANKSFEAIGAAPQGSPLAGAVVAIAERSHRGDDAPTLGVILGGPRPGIFQLTRHGGYEITDLAFLPGGDMLVLERWFKLLKGMGMRIRRISGRDLKPGALLDGPVLIEADFGHEVDNMEGLAVHQEGGKTMLTLISDDNFSIFQRTLLLEFELA